MAGAIPRYGARVLQGTARLVRDLARQDQLVHGPHVAAFEDTFASRLGVPAARATSYGRMAFYHLLHALDLPKGSEIVFPALTFWVVPEIARVAGFTPVFADVDPTTFSMDTSSLQRVISPRTRAVVPTHLWGQPCDMDAILDVARDHGLVVIEDCAHALGATYRGRPAGTLGDASFFSFQLLKPLNTYGGGMAVARSADVLARVGEQIERLPAPSLESVTKKLRFGRMQRTLIRRTPFTLGIWPLMWAASWTSTQLDTYIWEPIRSLDPLPADYTVRYSNAQAAIGLASLGYLADWTRATQAHAAQLDAWLAGEPGVVRPARGRDRTHVFYQYCAYLADRDRAAKRAVRRGVDVEMLHVDVCTQLALFADCRRDVCRGADVAAKAVQLPVYASLSTSDIERVARVVASAVGADVVETLPSVGPATRVP